MRNYVNYYSTIENKTLKHGFIGYGNAIKAIHRGLSTQGETLFGYYSRRGEYPWLDRYSSIKELVDNSNIIWLGIKPQNLGEILSGLKSASLENKVIISIIAGKSIELIEQELGNKIPIIRIMTNLAIEFGSSVTAYSTNGIKTPDRDKLLKTLKKCGVLVEMEEQNFDLFTAIFGSGPAFLLKFIDVMKSKMAGTGVNESVLNRMLISLIYGTADYLDNYCDQLSIDTLIKKIASKGGTTEAGLNHMTSCKIDGIFEQVLEIAQKRGVQLNKY